jgi:FlaA1/EpsC-like NDP-sugar epimerase
VQLVLQASTMGRGSEIFVLDMGSPVKIVDLARNMITLAGFVPDEDIEIKFVGLRPGEKMMEELSRSDENTIPTTHSKISVFKGPQMTFHQLHPWISELQHLLWKRDQTAIIEHMSILVPEYQPDVLHATANAQSSRRPATPEHAQLTGPKVLKTAAG